MLNRRCTRASKALQQQQYSKVHKEVRRSARQDRRRCIEDLAKQAQGAALQINTRELYVTTKKLIACTNSLRPVRDSQGRGGSLDEKENQLKRWAEHFEELLSRVAPSKIKDIPPAENPLLINCNTPTEEEVRK